MAAPPVNNNSIFEFFEIHIFQSADSCDLAFYQESELGHVFDRIAAINKKRVQPKCTGAKFTLHRTSLCTQCGVASCRTHVVCTVRCAAQVHDGIGILGLWSLGE